MAVSPFLCVFEIFFVHRSFNPVDEMLINSGILLDMDICLPYALQEHKLI